MFTLSAFADEISPDPQVQLDVLASCGVKFIELRSAWQTNVLALSDDQVRQLKELFARHGVGVSAIGSPIGKVKIDEPFAPHLAKYERALELCGVFGTRNVRVFSYYPPGEAHDWTGVEAKWETEVFERMRQKAALAQKAGLRLVHENEHRIYGDSPKRLERLFAEVRSPALAAAYDAANFVFCGYDPLDGWRRTKGRTVHFHIKDWKSGESHGCLAGEGGGQWPTVLAEAAAAGYDGFATLEPHLLGGGPTGGVTGPELFPKAVAACREVLARVGARAG